MSQDNASFVKMANSMLWIAGHSCWGILNAPATGEAIADMIAGNKQKVDMASFNPARLAGRKSRRLAWRVHIFEYRVYDRLAYC